MAGADIESTIEFDMPTRLAVELEGRDSMPRIRRIQIRNTAVPSPESTRVVRSGATPLARTLTRWHAACRIAGCVADRAARRAGAKAIIDVCVEFEFALLAVVFWFGFRAAGFVRLPRGMFGLPVGGDGELPSGGEGESSVRRGAWSRRQRAASALRDA